MASQSGDRMPVVRLAARAMATRFEIVLCGEDPVRLRSIGEEALSEITRIGKRFSFFDPSSEVSRMNTRAADEPVALAPDLFELLGLCREWYLETGGAFDPTVGALMRTWAVGTPGAELPGSEAIREALSRTGFEHVELDGGRVRYLRPGLMIDLGGIAKGWAIDQAMNIVVSHGVPSCLLHGGTSSVRVVGGSAVCGGENRSGGDSAGMIIGLPGPDGHGWRVGLADPYVAADAEWFTSILLQENALSVSGVRGKVTTVGGVEYGHVLDPRTGEALSKPSVAAVVTGSAAVGDALSTALLVMGRCECARVVKGRGFTTAARFIKTDAGWKVDAGSWPNNDCPPVDREEPA